MTEVNSSSFYTKLESIEESLDGEVTKTLKRRSGQMVLTNDSGSVDLKFKFDVSEDFATLKPSSTFAMDNIRTEQVILNIEDPNSSCLILPDYETECKYVVMPMRL